jgi:hypothetical protein
MKCYRINVTMKNGFKYSYTCIARMMPGMKAASEGYWTESVEVTEITEEEHREANHCVFEDEPKTKRKTVDKKTDEVLRKAIVKSGKIVDKGKMVPKTVPVPKAVPAPKKNPVKFSSLENFFDGDDPAPENKKRKKRV